ncbi:unnamed protein product, partial [Rotaria magnacalcarata]
IGINIDTYEHFYLSSPLPTDMQLTEFAVNMIVSNADSIEIYHLFNDARIQAQMEERFTQHMVQYRMALGRKQYFVPTSSQVIDQENINSQDVQGYNTNATRNNNVISPLRSVHDLNDCRQLGDSNFIYQERSTNAPENLEHNHYSFIDYTLDQLNNLAATMIEPGSSELISNQQNLHKQTNHNNEQTHSELQNTELPSNNNNFLQTEARPYDVSSFLANINTQQTMEVISELVRNKNHMLKRAFEEQTDNSTNKRLKNDEREQIQLPNFELEFNMMEPLSPIPIETQSTITIGDHQPNEEHYGEHNINQIDAIQITSSSNFTTSNMNNDVVPTLSSMNTIIKTFIMTTVCL